MAVPQPSSVNDLERRQLERQIGYSDALKILGIDDSKLLATIDSLAGGLILGVAAATSRSDLLALLDMRDELMKQAQKMLSDIGQRVRGAKGKNRGQLLMAAHAVVAVNAYFEALHDVELPISPKKLDLKRSDQLTITGIEEQQKSRRLVATLLESPLPRPSVHRPYERVVLEMTAWYNATSRRFLEFAKDTSTWGGLDKTKQFQFRELVLNDVPGKAVHRYEEGFRRISAECPEFKMWVYLTDSTATRNAIAELSNSLDTGLSQLQLIFETLSGNTPANEWPMRLADVHRAQLERPIVETSPSEVHSGLRIPFLKDAYVNPQFRLATWTPDAHPAEERWWKDIEIRNDLHWFLAGYLTDPSAVDAPLVVLGQPGSGKSLLTKTLAARLPPEEYLPIRVELRRVAADASVQDQIEMALREATGDRMEWRQLVQSAGDVLPVIMLDGFDELLQRTGTSRSDYLEQVRDFQRREFDVGNRVVIIVTSRVAVADRVRYPDETTIIKLEPFDDRQISQWLATWNSANVQYFDQMKIDPLPVDTAIKHRDLAKQPLLLLMLSLYDSDGNALQKGSDTLARADLYERLLTKFVFREIDKHQNELDDRGRVTATALELRQLSIVALAMFNRGTKSISQDDLDGDLKVLIPGSEEGDQNTGRVARRLSPGQLIIGRFFFVHESRALVDATKISVYEFLHATFGEYLVARLVSHTLHRIVKTSLADEPVLALGPSSDPPDDDLWTLLSFTPLTDDPQAVGFLRELIQQFPNDHLLELRRVLAFLLRSSLRPRLKGYGRYEPRRLNMTVRYAAFSANMLLLNVLAAQKPIRATAIFESKDRALSQWRSFAQLWQSQLDPASWDSLIDGLTVTRVRDGSIVDLEIDRSDRAAVDLWSRFQALELPALEPGPGKEEPVGIVSTDTGPAKIATQAMFLCDQDLDLVLHAIQPLTRSYRELLTQVVISPDGTGRSAIHTIIKGLLGQSQSLHTPSARRDRSDTSRQAQKAAEFLLWVGAHGSGKGNPPTRASKEDARRVITPQIERELLKESIHGPSLNISSNSAFEMMLLHISNRADITNALGSIPKLDDVERVLAELDPVRLAGETVPLITGVLRLARTRNLAQWSGRQGLVLLALVRDDKLRDLGDDDIEFVLASAAREPANSIVIQLIRDRRRHVVRLTPLTAPDLSELLSAEAKRLGLAAGAGLVASPEPIRLIPAEYVREAGNPDFQFDSHSANRGIFQLSPSALFNMTEPDPMVLFTSRFSEDEHQGRLIWAVATLRDAELIERARNLEGSEEHRREYRNSKDREWGTSPRRFVIE